MTKIVWVHTVGPILMGRLEHSKPTVFYGRPHEVVFSIELIGGDLLNL